MSKGSGRRPQQVSQEEMTKRWNDTFNPKPTNKELKDDALNNGLPVSTRGCGNPTPRSK